jgi:uncharacterized membrane protein
MNKLPVVGRILFAIPMITFGVQHLIYRSFVTRVVPGLPSWIPGHSVLAAIFGAFLIAAGGAILFGIAPRLTALGLGAVILVSFVLLYVPLLLENFYSGGHWTNAGKALALAGGSFLVAGSIPGVLRMHSGKLAAFIRLLEKFIPWGHLCLSAFLILCGILHFIYVQFVETLVPLWIPGHRFWTYFTGIALIAGGLGIIIPKTRHLAAALTAIMIFLWVVLLHIPRALANLHDANEMTAVFEALAMTGIAILIAVLPIHKQT